MEIREPRYKVGDKVYCKQYKSSATITGISDYSFAKDKYFHYVEWDDGNYLDEISEELLEPYVEKPKTVWDLKKGDTYYVIDADGDVSESNWIGYWFNYDYGEQSRKIGNAFLTKEEAEFECVRRKVETEMLRLGGRRKFEQGKANWYLEYRPASGAIEAMWTTYEMRQGAIYFDSEEKAKEAVEIIGKDIFFDYIFGVEE